MYKYQNDSNSNNTKVITNYNSQKNNANEVSKY